jgi:hypothetical protein
MKILEFFKKKEKQISLEIQEIDVPQKNKFTEDKHKFMNLEVPVNKAPQVPYDTYTPTPVKISSRSNSYLHDEEKKKKVFMKIPRESIVVKINQLPPPIDNSLKFIGYSKIDGYPIFEFTGIDNTILKKYPCEEIMSMETMSWLKQN